MRLYSSLILCTLCSSRVSGRGFFTWRTSSLSRSSRARARISCWVRSCSMRSRRDFSDIRALCIYHQCRVAAGTRVFFMFIKPLIQQFTKETYQFNRWDNLDGVEMPRCPSWLRGNPQAIVWPMPSVSSNLTRGNPCASIARLFVSFLSFCLFASFT